MNNISDTDKAKKNQLRNLLVMISIAAFIFIVFIYIITNQTEKQEQASKKVELVNPFEKAESETYLLEQVQSKIEAHDSELNKINKKLKPSDENDLKQAEIEARIKALESKLLNSKQNAGLETNKNDLEQSPVEDLPVQLKEVKLIHESYQTPVVKKRKKTVDNYVPAGTSVIGIVIEGAHPSAGVNSQANPEPMIIRLVDDGTLPNRFHSRLNDCRVTAAASGDISSERGKLRTERLSCVRPNGEIIDTAVEGTVAGPDGVNGIRGRLREGGASYVANMFAAGSLKGISDALGQSYTLNSVSPQGSVQSVDSGQSFKYAGAKGTSTGMDKLADYMMKRAEQFQPIVQLSAGTEVNVVFLKGFFLDTDEGDDVTTNGTQSQPVQSSNDNLTLSVEEIRKLQERSKELGLHVSEITQ